jgi:hypothetical protein
VNICSINICIFVLGFWQETYPWVTCCLDISSFVIAEFDKTDEIDCFSLPSEFLWQWQSL